MLSNTETAFLKELKSLLYCNLIIYQTPTFGRPGHEMWHKCNKWKHANTKLCIMYNAIMTFLTSLTTFRESSLNIFHYTSEQCQYGVVLLIQLLY